MGIRRVLEQRSEAFSDNYSLLANTARPILAGAHESAEDWFCPCGEQIGTNVRHRSCTGITIECPVCQRRLLTHEREPGEPIQGPPNIFRIPVGRFEMSETMNLGKTPLVLVGETALQQYAWEMNQHIPGITDGPPVTTSSGSLATELINASNYLENLLGARYSTLVDQDDRGQKSNTPPTSRHRMIELITAGRSYAAEINAGRKPHVDSQILAELFTIREQFEKWKNHPARPSLVETMAHETEPQHTLMLLSTAAYLASQGNAVGIYYDNNVSGQKTADLWMDVNLDRVEVEIKTPLAFRNPALDISTTQADTLVTRTVANASPQIKNVENSILVIGTFGMAEQIQTLRTASQKYLDRQTGKKQLATIMLADIVLSQVTPDRAHGSLQPVLQIETATHYGYSGPVTIVNTPHPDA